MLMKSVVRMGWGGLLSRVISPLHTDTLPHNRYLSIYLPSPSLYLRVREAEGREERRVEEVKEFGR